MATPHFVRACVHLVANSKEIRISKDVLEELPLDYVETEIGDGRGALRQYRSSSSSVHVREYEDNFTIHIDHIDPRRDPIGHLVRDSPETIASALTSLYFIRRPFDGHGRRNPKRRSLGIGSMGFLFSFLFMNGLFRWIKTILFG